MTTLWWFDDLIKYQLSNGGDDMSDETTTPPAPDQGEESTPGAGGVQPDQPDQPQEPKPEGDDDPAEVPQGAREVGRRDAQQLMGRGWAPITFCQQLQEGCEEGTSHRSRALRGALYGKDRVIAVVERRLGDAGVALHPWLRGQLVRPECSILGRTPDGHEVPGDVRVQVHPRLREEGQDQLLRPVGHSRSLAHPGTATSRTDRLQESRLVAVAEHSSVLQLAVTTIKGASC